LQRTGQLFVSSDFSFPLSPEQPWRIQVEMPSLGNSHHCAKNHTATTINNSNRSFIFILPGFPVFQRAFMPRLSGYPGRFRSMSAASLSFVVRPMMVVVVVLKGLFRHVLSLCKLSNYASTTVPTLQKKKRSPNSPASRDAVFSPVQWETPRRSISNALRASMLFSFCSSPTGPRCVPPITA
jgi:hypothetical protein